MAITRFGHLDDFTQKNNKVGIGTSTPQEKMEVIGGTRSTDLRVAGIATLTSAGGFIEKHIQYVEDQVIIDTGDSGTLSGEIIVGSGQTMTVGTAATTSQGTVDALKVYDMFQPPSGTTNQRPPAKTGAIFYNFDFKTIEFFDGNSWRQVDNTTRRGRGLFGGGQPSPSSRIDSLEIMTLGNGVNFGNLISAHANKIAFANSTRGIFAGGSTTDNMDYVTIASGGNGIDFGNLTLSRGYGGGAASSTRGVVIGGWAGSNPPSNVIDYVEIMTIGNALDFGDLFTGRYNHSSFGSPTRAFAYAGVNNNNGTQEASIEMFTIASKGNATDFGDAAAEASATMCGSSSSTRGIMGGGVSGPTYLSHIQYLTMSSSGSAQIFGDLAVKRQRPGGASTQTRSVFYNGYDGSNVLNSIEYITIATTGNAADFGDSADTTNYTKAGCSDSGGGLGGF